MHGQQNIKKKICILLVCRYNEQIVMAVSLCRCRVWVDEQSDVEQTEISDKQTGK